MNSFSQPGRKAVPGDLFSEAVFSELGRTSAHSQNQSYVTRYIGPPIIHSLSLLSFTVLAMLVLILVGKYTGDKAKRKKGIFLQGNPVE